MDLDYALARRTDGIFAFQCRTDFDDHGCTAADFRLSSSAVGGHCSWARVRTGNEHRLVARGWSVEQCRPGLRAVRFSIGDGLVDRSKGASSCRRSWWSGVSVVPEDFSERPESRSWVRPTGQPGVHAWRVPKGFPVAGWIPRRRKLRQSVPDLERAAGPHCFPWC